MNFHQSKFINSQPTQGGSIFSERPEALSLVWFNLFIVLSFGTGFDSSWHGWTGRTGLRLNNRRRRRKTIGGRRQFDFTRILRGLHNDLRQAVEEAALPDGRRCLFGGDELIRLVRQRISVANAYDFSWAGQFKGDEVVRYWNRPALRVGDLHRDDGDVFAVGFDRRAMRQELNCSRLAGGFDFGGEDFFAALESLAPAACRARISPAIRGANSSSSVCGRDSGR